MAQQLGALRKENFTYSSPPSSPPPRLTSHSVALSLPSCSALPLPHLSQPVSCSSAVGDARVVRLQRGVADALLPLLLRWPGAPLSQPPPLPPANHRREEGT
eukprot:2586436-Rhodomonas_salina.3